MTILAWTLSTRETECMTYFEACMGEVFRVGAHNGLYPMHNISYRLRVIKE
jgi:hypothetical protein